MAITLAPQFTQKTYAWSAWKAIQASKSLITQYDEDPNVYLVYGYDGPEVHLCTIWKGIVPDGVVNSGYSQAQNDADKTDFETNYKTTANAPVEPRAADGRMTVVTTTAKRTKSFKLRAVTIYTAKDISGVHSVNPLTDASYGDVTVHLYKPAEGNNAGWTAATDVDATMTVIDWDPLYAYEVIGGWVDIPNDLRTSFTNQWYLSCVGLPDYAQYGIAVDFVSEVNLEAVGEARVVSDGRATQYLSPTLVRDGNGNVVANYYTNRLRWIFKHPAGVQKRFQIFVETFA